MYANQQNPVSVRDAITQTPREIGARLSDLQHALSNLEEVVSILSDRIDPIMAGSLNKEPMGAGAPPATTILGENLSTLENRVRTTTQRLNDMIARVQL